MRCLSLRRKFASRLTLGRNPPYLAPCPYLLPLSISVVGQCSPLAQTLCLASIALAVSRPFARTRVFPPKHGYPTFPFLGLVEPSLTSSEPILRSVSILGHLVHAFPPRSFRAFSVRRACQILRYFSTVVVLSVRRLAGAKVGATPFETRGENAQPLTRSANSTDCFFRFNSDSVEIDATSRNFLRDDRDTDARSTSDGERRLAGPHENYLVRTSQRPLPRKTDVSRTRFFSARSSVSPITTNLAKTRRAPSRRTFEFWEICETAARLVGASNETSLRPINSTRFVEGRRQRRDAGRNAAGRALIAGTLFDLLERSVGDGRESVVTGVTKVPIISSGRRDKIRVVERAIK